MSDIEKGQAHTVDATSPQEAFRHQHNHNAAPAEDRATRFLQPFGPHTLGSGDAAYQYAAAPTRIANPGPLGLFSFASTTFMLSMYNAQTRGITHPNVVVGMALFAGGLAQFLAGMWEFPRGNAFGATAFTSYGAFWMSYATILIPSSGIGAAFASDHEFESAVGIYLIGWFMLTFFFLIAALRKSVSFIALLSFLCVTFLCLAGGAFTGHESVNKAGGVLGVITAFIAYYMALSELLTAERQTVLSLPLGTFRSD